MVIIKKPFNIIIFVLVFLAAAALVNGADAGINEETIYAMKRLNQYGRSIEEMKLLVNNLQEAVNSEKETVADYRLREYYEIL